MPDSGGIANLVITDSQPVTRYGLVCLLDTERRFKVVGETGDGQEIAKLCRQLKPAALILGLPFPELSAVKIIQDVQTASPATRILVFGTQADRDMITLLMNSGIDALLSKNVPTSQLITAVSTVLDGNTYFSPDAMVGVTKIGKGKRKMGSGYPELTEREREIFLLIAQTMDTKTISEQLRISTKTVENHRRRIMSKLGVKRTAELVRYAAALSMVA